MKETALPRCIALLINSDLCAESRLLRMTNQTYHYLHTYRQLSTMSVALVLACSMSSSSPSWNIFMKESQATAIMSRRCFIATFIGPMQSVCDIALMHTYMQWRRLRNITRRITDWQRCNKPLLQRLPKLFNKNIRYYVTVFILTLWCPLLPCGYSYKAS